MIEVYAPPGPGSLMRSVLLQDPGVYRLSRRSCELYSVQIEGSGAWARFRVMNGTGRGIFAMPSAFTGSFWVGGGSEEGLIVNLASIDLASTLMINYREPDREVV